MPSQWVSVRYLPVLAVVLTLAPVAVGRGGGTELARLQIPTGRPVTVDGVLSAGEWDDAVPIDIAVASHWVVRVLVKHDASNLYVAFTHLKHAGAERYPEVLLDPASERGNAWRPGQLWLHSSYNLCEGEGVFNLYRRDGVFLCGKTKSGWEANHFPLSGDGVMEIRIALARLAPLPRAGQAFGLALDVTDTQTSWSFWPRGAELARPSSWGAAVLAGGPRD
jgi:hypothetical protein